MGFGLGSIIKDLGFKVRMREKKESEKGKRSESLQVGEPGRSVPQNEGSVCTVNRTTSRVWLWF